jgi:guanine nucleotide-binding protein G(i) subunit alpha
MKIIHQDGFTRDELLSYKPVIFKNVVDSAQAIVLAMRKIGVDCLLPENRVRLTHFFLSIFRLLIAQQPNCDRIIDYRVENSPNFVFSESIASAIHNLWKDPIIPKVLDHSSEFYLMDSAS